MASLAGELRVLQEIVWRGSLPLEVRLASSDCRVFDRADPYLTHHPRLSYLPFLIPRLRAFFAHALIDPDADAGDAWFSFEDVPLKWHHPVGLLYDLFSGASPSRGAAAATTTASSAPWKLVLHFSAFPHEHLFPLDPEGEVLHDAFINSVKEADFLRNGNAKAIMGLSKDDSTTLWRAIKDHDMGPYGRIYHRLLQAHGAPLKHVPLRLYLPSSPPAAEEPTTTTGHLRVVQAPIGPSLPNGREPQTVGTALHSLLPSLFPSRRTPILARAVLHGAVVPMSAPLEDLMRSSAYLDGWLHLGIEMLS